MLCVKKMTFRNSVRIMLESQIYFLTKRYFWKRVSAMNFYVHESATDFEMFYDDIRKSLFQHYWLIFMARRGNSLERKYWKWIMHPSPRQFFFNISAIFRQFFLQEFLKRGCPPSLRGSIWGQVLGSQVAY